MSLTGINAGVARTGFINLTAVSGYTTARMQVTLPSGTTTSLAEPYGTLVFDLDGGDVAATVQVKQAVSQDYRSGRTAIGAALALTPYGIGQIQCVPTQQFVEIWCTANGPASLRAQVHSQLDYTLVGFTQNGVRDPQYPPIFWSAQLPPTL